MTQTVSVAAGSNTMTRILPVDPKSIHFTGDSLDPISSAETLENLLVAVDILQNTTSPVGFPTETVYGLGASALNSEAVKSIYAAKNRPADNPLIVHVASMAQLHSLCDEIPSIYSSLISKYFPGPLTIILPVPPNSPISPYCTHGQKTFAVRMPSNPVARALILLSNLPLAAPSANASTRPSPTLAQHVYDDLKGRIPLILDGGPCDVGLESTVVDGLADPPMILRPGGISAEQIRSVGGEAWRNAVVARSEAKENEIVRTPGMKYKHYSPKAKVILFENCKDGQDAFDKYSESFHSHPPTFSSVGILRTRVFGDSFSSLLSANTQGPIYTRDLGSLGSDISHNLFAHLRELDSLGVDVIFVEGIQDEDEGLAVMNRLRKASTDIIDCK